MLSMSEDKLQDLFLDSKNRSRVPSSRRLELDALIPDYVKRLSKKGVSVKSLHEEYRKEHPDGYQYTQFKLAIRAYKCQTRTVGHVEHLAGDQMHIDYAGDKLEIVDEAAGVSRQGTPSEGQGSRRECGEADVPVGLYGCRGHGVP